MKDRRNDGRGREGVLNERSGRSRGEGERHGERSGRGGGQGKPFGGRGGGAQTFRRGRVLLFLEQMQNHRTTLARQLTQEEFEHIRPVISGELKAMDQVIDEYIHLFELEEEHVSNTKNLESD
ncbi:hypothetical protein MH215_05525 [Paenibacillus sp. ACRSA]|uniref:hypothetical protein n=1 Tax=Paenibacillus sp. ACRSA TaxID=2918211 RepID=UPI001EF70E57|nr:hypothetical protein [Paenibacillus sp. ACRSA]MCG7376445.1 hypothetical protein [Paenibacillus sp. ACRSA]